MLETRSKIYFLVSENDVDSYTSFTLNTVLFSNKVIHFFIVLFQNCVANEELTVNDLH